MIKKFVITATVLTSMGMAALPAGAQTPSPAGPPTAGGQSAAPMPTPGANSVTTPDRAAQPPTTQNTTGSTPQDDSGSASARGGPGTGPVPGTSTNR